jgi:hypothetical protein
VKSVSEKEAIGDWSNLKGTRYHLAYALWLLLRGGASEVRFFAGNDLLFRAIQPPLDIDNTSTISLSAITRDPDCDIWVQLKATATDWTRSELLEGNLLFNFICNAAVSESNNRHWRISLITEADIRTGDIAEFAANPSGNPKLNAQLIAIVDAAQKHLASSSISRSSKEIHDIAVNSLTMLASTRRTAMETLRAEIETAIMESAPNRIAVRRIASTLIGALLSSAAESPNDNCAYTTEWLNREAGLMVVSQRPFDTNPIAACDLAADEASRPQGLLPFRSDRFVLRQSFDSAARQFLKAPETLFVLVGRSGIGKSWAIANLVCTSLRGHVRIVRIGSEVAIGTSLAHLAMETFANYSDRHDDPTSVVARLTAASVASEKGKVLFCIDDLRVPSSSADSARSWIRALVREARDLRAKLLLSCQDETWTLLRLHASVDLPDIFAPHRSLDETPTTHSIRLDVMSPEELEAALSKRLPPDRASRAYLHLRGAPFLYLRIPFIFERYLDRHQMTLGTVGSHPDPVAVDDLLSSTLDARLDSVATALLADPEAVCAAFNEIVDHIWSRRRQIISQAEVIGLVARHLPEQGVDALREFRAKGLLSPSPTLSWYEGILGDYFFARRLIRRSPDTGALVSELEPGQDDTVVETLIRMAVNGPELAERLLGADPRFRPSLLRGLSQRPTGDAMTFGLVASLTRPDDDTVADVDACEALGILAARGRRGVLDRSAWRKVIEMYLSGDVYEGIRGMHALASVLEYEPAIVGSLVSRRLRSVLGRAHETHRKGLGRRLSNALDALHNVTHRQAALAVERVLETISPYQSDTVMEERDKFIASYDYLRGRIAPFLGTTFVEPLIDALSSSDRTVRLRAAGAVRPAVYDNPAMFRTAILQAIRSEDDPDVLLRLLWAAPRLTRDSRDFLNALGARPSPVWTHPLPCGPALAILGEAADFESDVVSSLLPINLDHMPEPWIRACLSDVHALAWWRCARRNPSFRSKLEPLAEPRLKGVPRSFHAFAFRGAFIARLGLATLEKVPLTPIDVTMTSQAEGHLPYCYSHVEEIVKDHAAQLVAMPEWPSLLDMLSGCVSANNQARDRFYLTLQNRRFDCARRSLDELCILAMHVSDPLSILNRLPRDWEAMRAARSLLASNHPAEGLRAFAQLACDERAASGTPQAWHERSKCLARLNASRPDPVPNVGGLSRVSRIQRWFGNDDSTEGVSVLIDENPERMLEIIDRSIDNLEQMHLLYFWAKQARNWKAYLLASVHRRMFDPQALSPVSALRMTSESLAVFRRLPPSLERNEGITVFEGVQSWLAGHPVAPAAVAGGPSPFQSANRIAAEILTSSCRGTTVETVRNILMQAGLWWQSVDYRWEAGELRSGSGVPYYALAVLPAVRLAAYSVLRHSSLVDPVSQIMKERYRVCHELNNVDWDFNHPPATTAGMNLKWLDRVMNISSTLVDERIFLRIGDLFVRLGRIAEGEEKLQAALAHPLCTPLGRASAHWDLACAALRTGRTDRCRAMLEETLRLAPYLKSRIAEHADFESVRHMDWFVAMTRPAESR